MKRIGLTGGIASGKSLIVDMLRREKIPVIDADELSREVSAGGTHGLASILAHFGEEYAQPDGSLDRKKLGTRVFADESARLALEAIVHPLIRQAMLSHFDALENAGSLACVYCAPLIFEKRLESLFDAVILVYCDDATQLARLAKRDSLSPDQAKLRVAAQMPLSEKRSKTKYQIDNSGNTEQTAQQLIEAWHRITFEDRHFVSDAF
jgi:dephospho-CoA kinase